MIVSIVLMLWIHIAQLLMGQLFLGSVHNHFLHVTVTKWRDKAAFPGSREDLATDFVLIFVGTFFSVIVGYAAVYCGLHRLCPNMFVDSAASHSALGPIEFLYFSIVTVATVGYGDIQAVSRVSRLAVSSEILLSFALVAVLIGLYPSIRSSE